MKKSKCCRCSKFPIRLAVSAILVVFLLCACSKKPSTSPTVPPVEETPLIEGNTLTAAILDELQTDVIPGDDLPLSISYSNAVYKNISADILSQDDKTGQATVEFEYIDVLSLADGYKGDLENIDSFYEHCLETISSGDAATLTETVAVSYTVLITDNEMTYVVEEIENKANILSGGALSVLKDLMKGEE